MTEPTLTLIGIKAAIESRAIRTLLVPDSFGVGNKSDTENEVLAFEVLPSALLTPSIHRSIDRLIGSIDQCCTQPAAIDCVSLRCDH